MITFLLLHPLLPQHPLGFSRLQHGSAGNVSPMQQGTYGQGMWSIEEERSPTPSQRPLSLPPVIWKGRERSMVHGPCGPCKPDAEVGTEPLWLWEMAACSQRASDVPSFYTLQLHLLSLAQNNRGGKYPGSSLSAGAPLFVSASSNRHLVESDNNN